MRNVRVQLAAAALIVCFGASLALSCAFEFPWQLLDNRAATLDRMPLDTKSFAYAETHLVPSPKDNLTAAESEYPQGEQQYESIADAVAQAEVAGLSSDQADAVRQMRAEDSGDTAFSKGALLPASVRLYTAGAVDFHKGDSAKAIARFQAILDLPANERRDRAVWSAFMLGRLYSGKDSVEKASESFALTRELANNGAPDPLGLGVASFGEEARLHLKRAQALQKSKTLSPQQQREFDHEIVAAVRLYAQQAAHGSAIGIDSLRFIVDEVPGVTAAICDPMVQQLLVTRRLDAAAGASNNRYTPLTYLISTLVTSVQKCGSGNLVSADRLAAIAYGDGDYRLAKHLAGQATGPLAAWVKARLAMQKGNVAEAAKYYAEASKAFPSSGDLSSDEATKALLVGENGVLTLSRGEYVDALEQLYPYSATFWGDVAYIAERVLTVDELKTFVDTHKDTQFHPAVSLDNLSTPLTTPSTNPDEPQASEPADSENGPDPADQLRDLLARRLVRAGRYQEALKYFPPPNAETSTPSDYAQALADANTNKSNVDRARAWYRAATLAGDFKSGNQIMATEGPPDNYGDPSLSFGGIGRFELRADDRFVTDGERQRFKASAVQPNLRYHYIFVGVDEALHAADLLPPRSQAFAAVFEWRNRSQGRGSDARNASPKVRRPRLSSYISATCK